MQVVCLEEEAFFELIEKVVSRIHAKQKIDEDQWLSDGQAMQLLKIKSKTTLQKLRDEGRIKFSQPQKKIILYDRHSIMIYLEKHAHQTF